MKACEALNEHYLSVANDLYSRYENAQPEGGQDRDENHAEHGLLLRWEDLVLPVCDEDVRLAGLCIDSI